jgi:hypothetical protein
MVLLLCDSPKVKERWMVLLRCSVIFCCCCSCLNCCYSPCCGTSIWSGNINNCWRHLEPRHITNDQEPVNDITFDQRGFE